jgi:two-component system, chemotaxis family, chemotaxis protein CheY
MEAVSIKDLAIALVEPSPTQQRIIKGHLLDMGVSKMMWFQDMKHALDGIQETKPDLVISAMHLADGTGTELAQALRANPKTHDILFMLVSSETSYRYLEPLKQAGVVAILPKPFVPSDLRYALNATLDYLVPDQDLIDSGELDNVRVLVVDDSLTSRHHIRRVLNNMGIEHVTEVENGVKAMREIEKNYFDLVVTDYNMPELDGQQLTRYIRQKSTQRSIPILMVTSITDEKRLMAVKKSGVSAVCDKPFESGGIKELVRKMLSAD